jgi:hypothetical protein
MANPDVGYGTSITYGSGFFAQITSIQWDGLGRRAIDVTHMASPNAYMAYMPSDLKDAGTITVEILFDPDDAVLARLSAAAETITITFAVPSGGSTAATWACSGFMIEMGNIRVPLDDRMEATVKLKLTGLPTITAGT